MPEYVTIFLAGDVMTGRGIDQISPNPSDPRLFEPYMKSASGYVQLAEEVNGAIPREVDLSYVWGDALPEITAPNVKARIINLETGITVSDDNWPGKGIHYRMHPRNISSFTYAGIDCCVLANNHILDWGYAGMSETLQSLSQAGIRYAGAGKDLKSAGKAAKLKLSKHTRLLIFSYGMPSSGVPAAWAATGHKAGVNLLPYNARSAAALVEARVKETRQPGDLVMVSLHWGGNWDYQISSEQRRFAHYLIDNALADIIFGHSSHHVKGIEVYHGKLILYGCGDFINDYEGISGHEAYRSDLGLMYFPKIEMNSGELHELVMVPTQVKKFRVHKAGEPDARWLENILNREGRKLGTRVDLTYPSLRLSLRW